MVTILLSIWESVTGRRDKKVVKKIFSNKKVLKYAIILISAGIIITGGYYLVKKITARSNTQSSAGWTPVKVALGDIDVKISGAGTVQPISRFDIVPLIKGNILSAPIEKGNEVKKGDLLYEIDDSEQYFNIEKTRASIEKLEIGNQQTEESITNLTITAPFEGRIIDFKAAEGDQIGGNNVKIASIVDDKQLTAIIPFNASQAQSFKTGGEAKLLLSQFMMYVDGVITYISSATKPSKDGTALCDVEIKIDNPGTITEGMEATGIVKTPDGDIISPSTGKIMFSKEYPIMAKSSGTVKEVYVKDNDWVSKGQKILELENESLLIARRKNLLDLKDLQLSLDSQIKKLDDYNILSPIDGIVINKYYKAGDTVGSSSSGTTLMTVADMSKMVFSIDVDELDIAKISIGQKVNITADALSEETFEGEVTNIPLEGKSQSGVTTYQVEVTINEPGKLMPGMNINAEILVDSRKDVLYVPMAAVAKIRDKTYVYVDQDSQKGQTGQPDQQGSIGQSEQQGPTGQPGRQQTQTERQDRQGQAGQQSWQSGGGQIGWQREAFSAQRQNPTQNRQVSAATNGRQLREVVVGINNEDYIEIVSGLNEGETVYVAATAANSNMNNSMMPNIMGGGTTVRIMEGEGGPRQR